MRNRHEEFEIKKKKLARFIETGTRCWELAGIKVPE